MKIPLVYPKIPGSKARLSGKCVLFDKIDGTNMHWAWSQTAGFHSFGLRRRGYTLSPEGLKEFEKTHIELIEAPHLFESIKRDLIEVINMITPAPSDVNIFTEFVGKGSFAGRHLLNEGKELVFIDALVDGKFLAPETFLETFKGFKLPKVLYRGNLGGGIVEDIRRGRFEVMEGAVAKGVKRGEVWMIKIKTNAYRKQLESKFGKQWQEYWE